MSLKASTRRRALSLAVLAALAAAGPAFADEMTVIMRNSHPYAVEVELYSQDRDHVWPGNGEVYYLDDGEAQSMPIACLGGETICYGAWVSGDPGTYWGVGPDDTDGCERCCYVCDDGVTEEIELVE
ncbi:hypothetical protein N1F89_08105 [Aquibium sp. A9E412]|uniref:hypothetical protein n=1 Tax=Aquibium sp. A9E412 TaxID=2976767 RepID=UPI0025AF7105|nr:hypothetical protein [Aquibium sp. A9E412]MDN2566181.1 hypothetical protein [Aquibium sp. A9E412]